jgi:predicted permease
MIQDLRHAWRSIRSMPFLAAVVVLSLAVGVGVNTAVFSWVEAMILRPLPGVPDAGALHLLEPRADTGSYPGVSWPEYLDLRERTRALGDIFAFRMAPLSLGEPGRVERAYGQLVSPNYFSALGLQPVAGRFFRADEGIRPGADPIVVVSHDFWRTRLGGDPAAIGRSLRVNGQMLTVVGVAPERFQGTILMLNFDLWVPATMAPVLLGGSQELEDRSLRGYSVVGRLQPGATLAHAQAECDDAMRALAREYPATNDRVRGEVIPFWQSPRGPQRMLGAALLTLQGLMLLLLLAVCGNTANLMLARASTRQREVGMRLAIGASRWRIATLLLTENLVLALAGAALGAAVAVWATDALRAVPMISTFPIRVQTRIDGIGLAFAIALGVLSGFLFGAAPAAQLSRVDPQVAIRAGLRAAGRSALRNVLMGVQVSLALLVLIAAGLFLRSFGETREMDPGFRREGVLLAAYDMSGRAVSGSEARDFARRLLQRVHALPSVEAASIAAAVPLDIHGLAARSFTLEGRARPAAAPDQALSNLVAPEYFKTMGIAIRAGSDFADLGDERSGPQAMVNEEFVRRFLDGGPLESVLGRRVETRGGNYTVVGVVKNSLLESFGEPAKPIIYLSYRDRPSSRGEVHVRTRAGAEILLAPELERVVRELDPTLPLYDVRTLGDHVEKNLILRRIPARMFVVLGPMLLMLAAVGIYAVVAYSVSQRTTEIGVRLALGGTTRRIVGQIVLETLRVIVAGALIAWALAAIVSLHLVRGPLSLSVFAGIPALMLIVGAIACWIPAQRAVGLDPVAALRQE